MFYFGDVLIGRIDRRAGDGEAGETGWARGSGAQGSGGSGWAKRSGRQVGRIAASIVVTRLTAVVSRLIAFDAIDWMGATQRGHHRIRR